MEAEFNALEAKVQRRFANGLISLLSYTFGKSIDTSSGYFNVENGPQGASSVQNYFDLSSARGISGYDIKHFVSWATVYELPAGKGKRWLRSGPGSWILGNWQANYIFQGRSGQPYGLIVPGDVANLKGSGGIGSNGPSDYARPNMIADPFQPGPVPANPNPKWTSRGRHPHRPDVVQSLRFCRSLRSIWKSREKPVPRSFGV